MNGRLGPREIIAILATNAVPILGVVYLGWDLATIYYCLTMEVLIYLLSFPPVFFALGFRERKSVGDGIVSALAFGTGSAVTHVIWGGVAIGILLEQICRLRPDSCTQKIWMVLADDPWHFGVFLLGCAWTRAEGVAREIRGGFRPMGSFLFGFLQGYALFFALAVVAKVTLSFSLGALQFATAVFGTQAAYQLLGSGLSRRAKDWLSKRYDAFR